ncbi:MAG TPA: peptidase [Thermoanaerobaculia bacterium]|nr:peptidase [Thermoanaerobaculia bacterium]
MTRYGIIGVCSLAAALGTGALAPAAAQPPAPATGKPAGKPASNPIVERIGNRAFIQVESPSFANLTPKQKLLAYHLSRAAIQLDPVFYDQMSDYGIPAKRLLGALVERPERLPAAMRQPVVDYAKQFFANSGNHDGATGRKFLPAFSFEDFAEAAEQARQKGAPLGTKDQLKTVLGELRQPLFDPNYQVSVTNKNPPPGEDILTASSNNLYQGVTLEDLKGFTERFPLNSRLVKKDGKIVEEVYRAGTPDGKVPPGLYARELKAVIRELEQAIPYAEPDQAKVLQALIRFYQTGSAEDWAAYNVLWIRNDPEVDMASGFIEVYRDARGAKGSAQTVVSVRDKELGPLMQKLAANAVYFEGKAPWADKYKKLDVEPPVGKAIETVIATGDFTVNTVGVNLPNEQDIREKHGTKSVLLTNASRALNATRGVKLATEFSMEPDEQELFEKHGTMAGVLHVAMHEVIGHGSGKVAVPNDPRTYLREYYSTLEEARADLVSYWNIYDPKLAELGVEDVQGVAKELYRALARQGLTTLNRYPTGDEAEEDHDRNRLLIVNYLIEAGAFERLQKDGHWYITVKDYDKAHATVGKLLAELMRIKAEGDYDAIKALVDKYGVHFDPAVRDDVVARFKKLDIPTYYTGIYPDFAPKKDKSGKVTAVEVSYPRDFLRQQLEWARLNGTLGFTADGKQATK